MNDKEFNLLMASVKQAGEIKKGKLKAGRITKIAPPDVRNIRKTLHVTQNEFAHMIGVSLGTLRNWEQGRRRPKGPAKALLKIAARRPKAVLEALHS